MRKKRQRRFGFRAEVLINPDDDDGRDRRLVNKAAIKSGVPSSYRLGRQVEEKVL